MFDSEHLIKACKSFGIFLQCFCEYFFSNISLLTGLITFQEKIYNAIKSLLSYIKCFRLFNKELYPNRGLNDKNYEKIEKLRNTCKDLNFN